MIPSNATWARWTLLGLGTVLLCGCSLNPGRLRVHEASLYGAGAQRIVWIYGDLGKEASASLKVGTRTVTLRPAVSGPLAVADSLSIDGAPVLSTAAGSLTPPLTLTQQGGAEFSVTAPAGRVQAIYYTDGQQWQRLSGTVGSVRGMPVTGLRGAGQLSDAEADALTDALSRQGPLAVAVLPGSELPDAPLRVEPVPTEYRRTALYLLSGSQIGTSPVASVPQTPPPSPTGESVSPTSPTRLPAPVEVDSGTNAATESPRILIARTAAEARLLYGVAYGRQTGRPQLSLPRPGEALIGLFIGQRNTGGYSVRVTGGQLDGEQLNLSIELTEPGKGAITTQALTSPWTIVRVSGAFRDLQVTDQTGRPFEGSGE